MKVKKSMEDEAEELPWMMASYRRSNLGELDRADLMRASRATSLADKKLPVLDRNMGPGSVPRCKRSSPARTGCRAVAEAFQKTRNTHSERGRRKSLVASCMHSVGKPLARRACFATKLRVNLAEPHTQEVLLDDHYSELAKLRDGDAGLEFSAGLGENVISLLLDVRTKPTVQ
jgi:hypothetical protein